MQIASSSHPPLQQRACAGGRGKRLMLRKLFPTEQPFEKEGSLQTIWISLPLNPDGSVGGVAIDPGTRKEAALAYAAGVGNEIFYPSASSGGSQR